MDYACGGASVISQQAHLDRLQDLPSFIDGCFLNLRFNNGPLPNSERKRAREGKPNPETYGEEAPRKLLTSTDHKIGDLFLLDAFAAGKQAVSCLGRRFAVGWKEGTPRYIAFEQGAFVTNSPEITEKPQIRDGGSGSVLLRCLNTSLGNKQRRSQKMTIEDGEIGGMLHLLDLQPRASDEIDKFIMYAGS